MEESLWLRHNGTLFTRGPGAYKIPGFSDIPQTFNTSLLRDASWPDLGTVHSSKGVGEPPLFLGCSVYLAMRDALKSARADNGVTEIQPFVSPLTSERSVFSPSFTLAFAEPFYQSDAVSLIRS